MTNERMLERVKVMGGQQLRVLSLLTFGYSNKQISGALGIAPTTVKHYVSLILNTLECNNRTQAALIGISLLNQTSVAEIVGRRRSSALMQVHVNRFDEVRNAAGRAANREHQRPVVAIDAKKGAMGGV